MNFSILKDTMDRLTQRKTPGNACVVYLDGERVFSYASGFSDAEKTTPMTGEEQFYIYSCSKITTVTAALQLLERGYYLLDDPLYDLIPSWRDATCRLPDGSIDKVPVPVTLRHLFTMTAGLSYNFATPAFAHARELTGGRMDTVTVASCLAEDPLLFVPGTHWNYSLCHDVLAAVVEVVSGMRFRDYVKKNIWDPLDITTGSYHLTEAQAAKLAPQYTWNVGCEDYVLLQSGKAEIKVPGRLDFVGPSNAHILGPEYDSGGAGVIIDTEGYARFAAALARGGLGLTGERILSPGTVELMATDQLTDATRPDFNWKAVTGYGYGLGVRTVASRAVAGYIGPAGANEFGWGGAAGATILMDPSTKVAMFYTQHVLNPEEEYYQPRIRNAMYASLA